MNTRRGSVLSLAVLSLTACGAISTQYLPNGYRYNDDTPYSSPAPSRPWLDEADKPDLEALGDNTAAWQGAVYELINPLPGIVPPAGSPIALKTTPPSYVAESAFDHYLRQGLISYGYTVNADANAPGTVIAYNATPITNKDALKKAQAKYGKDAVSAKNTKGVYYLTLDIQGPDGKTISQQSSLGVFPHDKTEYMRFPGFSYTPTQGKRTDQKPVYVTRD